MASCSVTAEDGRRPEDGFLTIQFVWAVALSLTLLVAVANLVSFQYGRGVVRAALDEGVRAGSRAGAPEDACLARVQAALSDLLGGTMGRDIDVSCRDDGARVVADATVTFHGWLPVVPDWSFRSSATAVKERAP